MFHSKVYASSLLKVTMVIGMTKVLIIITFFFFVYKINPFYLIYYLTSVEKQDFLIACLFNISYII